MKKLLAFMMVAMFAITGFTQSVEVETADTLNGASIVFQTLDKRVSQDNSYGHALFMQNIGMNSADTAYISLFGSNDNSTWAKLTTADSILIAPASGVAVVHLISGTTTPYLYYKRRINNVSTDTVRVINTWVFKK